MVLCVMGAVGGGLSFQGLCPCMVVPLFLFKFCAKTALYVVRACGKEFIWVASPGYFQSAYGRADSSPLRMCDAPVLTFNCRASRWSRRRRPPWWSWWWRHASISGFRSVLFEVPSSEVLYTLFSPQGLIASDVIGRHQFRTFGASGENGAR